MKFDDIIKELGEFGPFQKRMFVIASLPAVSIGSFMFLNVVVLAAPEHRCKLPGIANDTFELQGTHHAILINNTIPGSSDKDLTYDKCEMYVNHTGEPTRQECSEWVYSTSVFKNTFTKQEDLVCGDELLPSHSQTAFYFGVLVGSIAFGQMSDIIGRKKTMYIGLHILLYSSVGLAFAPEYYSFTILLFIVGCCCIGTFMTEFVLVMEFVGASKRVWVGCIIHSFGTTGALYLVLMSYLLRDWMWIAFSVGAPCVFFLSYWWILPDSPRWLLSAGRTDEAKGILQNLAHRNGTSLTDKMLQEYTEDTKHEGRLWHLFSTRTLGFRTIIIFINWFIVSMAYYGVILNVGNLGGDFYFNLFLLTVVEYPAKAISIGLMNIIGRKKLYVGYMMIGGLACVATVYPVIKDTQSLHWLLVTLAVIGKMGVTGGFETIYVLSAELYPTEVRNVGMGTSSAFARAGSMLAPYMAKSASLIEGSVGKAIPLAFFGIASFVAALLSLTLPETLNKRLPETIEDADKFTSEEFQKNTSIVVTQETEPTHQTQM